MGKKFPTQNKFKIMGIFLLQKWTKPDKLYMLYFGRIRKLQGNKLKFQKEEKTLLCEEKGLSFFIPEAH